MTISREDQSGQISVTVATIVGGICTIQNKCFWISNLHGKRKLSGTHCTSQLPQNQSQTFQKAPGEHTPSGSVLHYENPRVVLTLPCLSQLHNS